MNQMISLFQWFHVWGPVIIATNSVNVQQNYSSYIYICVYEIYQTYKSIYAHIWNRYIIEYIYNFKIGITDKIFSLFFYLEFFWDFFSPEQDKIMHCILKNQLNLTLKQVIPSLCLV